MNFSSRLLQQFLLLLLTATIFTSAMACKKLILNNGPTGNVEASKDIMETGRYTVRTRQRTNSQPVQALLHKLDGARDINYHSMWFTAVLEPRDLKKLCRSQLVISIKVMEEMNNGYKCNKLVKGNPKFVISSSYIVIIKKQSSLSGMMPVIVTASNDMNNSVMITGIREFQNRNRRGATMRMNHDGVRMMCDQAAVDYIEEDQEVNMSSITPLWHLDRIDQTDLPLDGLFSTPNNGSGIDIYIFDTGIRYDHDEFEGRVKNDFYDPVDILTGSNQQGSDCQGHGTHVAALAAGKTFGVAKGATLYSTRVLSCSGSGSYSNVLLGINHVIGEQIVNKDRRIIISMSLRGPISRAVHDAIRDATEEGILVVVAAGNDFSDACRFSPGASPLALTVGGTQRNDDIYLRLFDGSNYGSCVDIFAPAQDIRSASFSTQNGATTFTGTSQATPLVSGAAAVYWSMNRMATGLEVKDAILSSCTRDKLSINNFVPSEFHDQSPNCLLHIDPLQVPAEPYQVFSSVPSAELHTYIEDMEDKSYKLIYIHSHSINSSHYYSLIFKYMASVEFKTLMHGKVKQIKSMVADHEANGYQATLLYDMNGIDYIAVVEKTSLTHFQTYRTSRRGHNKAYKSKSLNNTLLSTTISLTNKGSPRYSSVYAQGNTLTQHLPSINIGKLRSAINRRFKGGYYLNHFSTVPTSTVQYSLVFHEMTKTPDNYILVMDATSDQVEDVIQSQLMNGFTPLVVAGVNTGDGLKYFMSYEL
ncbi:uncharacterized protein [Dysidea avara]|uniref:uncharacterized protein n=1 Tax=Dysidea avara TaxID=196820 RepID=UPI003324E7B7